MFDLYLKGEIVNNNLNIQKEGLSVFLFVGVNGVGKTTLMKEIFKNNNECIEIADNIEIAYLSQMQGEILKEANPQLKENYNEYINLIIEHNKKMEDAFGERKDESRKFKEMLRPIVAGLLMLSLVPPLTVTAKNGVLAMAMLIVGILLIRTCRFFKNYPPVLLVIYGIIGAVIFS